MDSCLAQYRYVWLHMESIHTQVCICTYVSLLGQLKGPRRNHTPVAMNTLTPRSWFLIPVSNKSNQGSSEKWLIQGQAGNISDECEACCGSIK